MLLSPLQDTFSTKQLSEDSLKGNGTRTNAFGYVFFSFFFNGQRYSFLLRNRRHGGRASLFPCSYFWKQQSRNKQDGETFMSNGWRPELTFHFTVKIVFFFHFQLN